MSNKIFKDVSKAEWLDKVVLDLKGREIEELNWNINKDLIISPFKDSNDIPEYLAPTTTKTNNSWVLIEPIYLEKTLTCENKKIIQALKNGVGSLKIYVNRYLDQSDFGELFSGVLLDIIHTQFELSPGLDLNRFIDSLEAFLLSLDYKIQDLDLSFSHIQTLEQSILETYPKVHFIEINSLPYYLGKHNILNELSEIIFCFQKNIEKFGVNAVNQMHLTIALDDCYILNIAKVRAIRRTLRTLVASYNGQTSMDIKISGILSENCMTSDVNYNRIKSSAIALSGTISGIDRLQIFNQKFCDTEDEMFSRRIAQNVSNILSLESYLTKVADPAKGSYYIESLTEELALKSWTQFQNKWSKENLK